MPTTLCRAVPTKLWKEGFVVPGKIELVAELDSPKKVGLVINCVDVKTAKALNKKLDTMVQEFNQRDYEERVKRREFKKVATDGPEPGED